MGIFFFFFKLDEDKATVFKREKILTGARKKEAKTDISHYKCEYVSSEVGQATLNYNLQLQ